MDALSHRFHLITFIGLAYGLLAGGTMYVAAEWLPPLAGAALALAAVQLLNRFLHFDGLIDLGDGLVCGGTPERKLAAMKDSKTGAGGVGYVVTFTLLSLAALGSIKGRPELLFLPLIAEIMNKNAMVLCASAGRPREGLGNAFVANTSGEQALASIVLSSLLAFGAVGLLDLALGHWDLGTAAALALVGALVSSLVGLYMSRVAMRNFGAVNGDVLGATNEIARPIVLLVLLMAVGL